MEGKNCGILDGLKNVKFKQTIACLNSRYIEDDSASVRRKHISFYHVSKFSSDLNKKISTGF